MKKFDYDLFVVGAGSGGVRAARNAAELGKKVAIAEQSHLGGTCVNVGCVPKKLLFYAAHFSEEFKASQGFGWELSGSKFVWQQLMLNKNLEIARLRESYNNLLNTAGVVLIDGKARLLDPQAIQVNERRYTCEHILIATGSSPWIPDKNGRQHVVTSNDMFTLGYLPEKMLIVGGGYIGMEFAGIMNGLGVDTTVCHRGDAVLKGFDQEIRTALADEMRKKGIKFLFNQEVKSVEKKDHGFIAHLKTGERLDTGLVMFATGRRPNTDGMGLAEVGVKLTSKGAIKVNQHYQTDVPSIYALGDVIANVSLTPVAISEAISLVDHLFKNETWRPEYQHVPTCVFSQPNIATLGLTEAEARSSYDDIDIFRTRFSPMKHSLTGIDEKCLIKMVVRRSTDKVLGIHMLGQEAGEIIQGMAVAIRAGAGKAVFDATIGIHPTAAEEFFTMQEPVN